MTKQAIGTLRLVAATDAHFMGMAAGRAPDGLRLPPGGVEAAETIDMLRGLAQLVRQQIDPAAWMIVDRDEVVGLCSITSVFPSPGMVEIGYGIAPEHRGRGLASQAVGALLALLREDERIRSVTAETAVADLPSQHVLKKNGFVRTGGRIDPEDGAVFCWQIVFG